MEAPTKVHPAAEMFPMMSKKELQALAEDIKSNGLQQPIITWKGLLLDGRNRRAACKLAKVEPTYQEYEGDDPIGYIISANAHRRHLTKAQRIDIIQRLRDEGKTLQEIAGQMQVSVGTVHAVVKKQLFKAEKLSHKIKGADGKMRSATYKPRKEKKAEPVQSTKANEYNKQRSAAVLQVIRALQHKDENNQEEPSWKTLTRILGFYLVRQCKTAKRCCPDWRKLLRIKGSADPSR